MKILSTSILGFAVQAGVAAELMGALIEDERGEYAVYAGLVRPVSTGDPAEIEAAANWLAGNGSKQTFKQAAIFFVNLNPEKYRR